MRDRVMRPDWPTAPTFQHPLTTALPAPGSGWTPLPSRAGGPNLDYVRANLFDPATLRLLPRTSTGPTVISPDLLDHYIQRPRLRYPRRRRRSGGTQGRGSG